VIGVIVPFDLLQAVSELADDPLFQYLAHLKSAEFIYETNLFPKLEYTFKHALTNEVAYGMLLRERRSFLHAQIMGALEEMAGISLHDHIETLAYHSLRGEIWNKAVVYLRDAGTKSVSRSGFRQAVRYFEQALEALEHLPETRDTLRHAVDLRIEIRNALFILGQFGQALNYLQEAQALATALNDEGRLGQVFNLMTAHWNLTGNSEEAITSAKQAIKHTEAREYLDLHIVAHYFLGVAQHNLGQYDAAVGVLQRALSLIGGRKYELFGTAGIVSVICNAWLVRALAQLGRFGEAMPYGDEAVKTALDRNHGYSIAYAYYGIGVLLLIKGEFDQAIAVLERGLETCETADIPVQRPLITSCLGAAYAFVGRLDKGLPLLEAAVEYTASIRRLAGQSLRMGWLGEGYNLAGRTEEAERLARQGFELSLESKDKGSQAWLLRNLGNLAAQRNPLNIQEAETNYGQGLRLAQELRMRPLEAHCHLGFGQVYGKLNDVAKSRTELVAAIDLYQQMAMSYWLSKAQSVLTTIS
jgi:tetratricopeptide (TPR) repeat protein